MINTDRIEKIIGAPLVRKENDVGIRNGRLSSSSCYMNFENGHYVKISTEEYSDGEYRDMMRSGIGVHRKRTKDAGMTEVLGYPTFSAEKGQMLEADITEDRFLYIYLRNDGSQRIAKQSGGPGWAIVRYKRDEIPNAREKLVMIAQELDFK